MPAETGGGPTPRRDLDELMIALAVTPEVGHEAACRLAAARVAERPVDWTTAPSKAVPELASELEISAARLRAARDAAGRRGPIASAARDAAGRQQARAVTRLSPEYPRALLDLELPPPVLWVRGALPARPCVSIVGPRNADRWALDATRGFAHDLAARGLVVVSGFARGVDACAHRSALEAAGGRTVAVLGCGLGVRYPSQHHELTESIAEAGAVISEYPCGVPPAAWRFPVRNRIIAALGIGTLVVQASQRSGSLITARLALELGREVYAVPGRPADRRSQGTNLLLRDGAHVALDARSVLDTLPIAVIDRLEAAEGAEARGLKPGASGAADASGRAVAARVLEALRQGTTEVEELARRLDLGMDVLLGVLLELELDGRARRLSRREYTAG